MERVAGIEPASSAWKAEVLPLNYTRRITALWWWGKDSNLRRLSRQIYSLIPLTTREPHLLPVTDAVCFASIADPIAAFQNAKHAMHSRPLPQTHDAIFHSATVHAVTLNIPAFKRFRRRLRVAIQLERNPFSAP